MQINHEEHEVQQRLNTCQIIEPGRLDYKTALVLQESYVKNLTNGGSEALILLEHPPVITLGRGFHRENLLLSAELLKQRGVAVEESGRGGDVTYHGPGQVVGYPILNLSERPDLHLYLRNLEELMIRCVSDFGLQAERKKGMTGIWVQDEKIGAIGVRVSRWITSHGFAFNVNTDLSYFDYIVPCGIKQFGVTSLKKLLGTEISIADVHKSLIRNFGLVFQRRLELERH